VARTRRPAALVLAALVPAFVAGVGAVSVARATSVSPPDPSAEAGFVARIGYERSSRGLPPVRVFDDLTSVARNHSEDMAAQQQLSDDQNLPTEVQGWQSLGGNAGEGPSVDQVHQAFMASPTHRDNILDPAFTDIGVGVVWTGSTLWVTEVFRQPAAPPPTAAAASAVPPPPPTTTPPTPAPSLPPSTEARPAVRPAAPPPTRALPPVTAAPLTAPPTVALSAVAVPPPDRFAIGDDETTAAAGPPGNGGHTLIALGGPLGEPMSPPAALPPGRHLPPVDVLAAIALLVVDLMVLAAAAQRGGIAAFGRKL
jgi:hypothetical protein